jgi:glycolate oxidase FAD binding subunit
VNIAAETLPVSEMVQPATQAELAAIVRQRLQSATPIYPIGGGTSLDYGLTPKQPGIGLSLAALNQIVDYPARDMTITVEAGITLKALREAMAAERQRLPVDAPEANEGTLGGLIATNFSGPRRYLHGTIRDYVIGISAVDGHGTAFKAGGRVVKNVAGYDFCKLLTGSLGTLAVITQVTLKVRPMARRSAFVVARLDEADRVESLLESLSQSTTTPAAIEVLHGTCWNGLLPGSGEKFRALVGLEGTEPEVDWMLGQLDAEWRAAGVEGVSIVDPDEVAALWEALVEFPADRSAALVIKANVPPGATMAFVRQVLEIDPAASIQAHAGNGIVIARLAEIPAEGLGNTMVKRLQPVARAAGGSAIVLRCGTSGELTRQVVWGPPPADLGLMQAVKRQFDPHGLFNPGRFLY